MIVHRFSPVFSHLAGVVRSRGFVSYPGPDGQRLYRFYREVHRRVSFDDDTGVRRLYLNAALPLDRQQRLRLTPEAMVCPACGYATAAGGVCGDCRTEALAERAAAVGMRLAGSPCLSAHAPEDEPAKVTPATSRPAYLGRCAFPRFRS